MDISSSLLESLERIADSLSKRYVSDREEIIKILEIIASDVVKKAKTNPEKLHEEYVKSLKSSTRRYSQESKEEAEYRLRRELANSKTGKVLSGLNSIVDKSTDVIYRTTSALVPSERPLTGIVKSISNVIPLWGATAFFGSGISIAENLISTYGELNKTGVQVSDGILGAWEATARMGLSFENGVKLFKENTLTIQNLGLPAVTQFTQNVRNSSSELYALGLSVEDISTKSIEYLEIQRKVDSSNLKDISVREEKFKEQLTKFYRTTQIIGTDLTKLMDQYKQAAEDPVTRLFLQTLPDDVRDVFVGLQSAAPDIATAVQQSMMRGSVARIDNYEELARIGAIGHIEQLVNQFKSGIVTSESIFSIIKQDEAFFEQQFETQSDMMQTGAAQVAAQLAQLANQINLYGQQVAGNVDEFTKNLLNVQPAIQNQLRNIQLELLKGIQGVDFGELTQKSGELGGELQKLLTGVKGLVSGDGISRFITKLDEAADEMLGESTILNTIIDNPLSTVMIAGFGSLAVALSTSSLLRDVVTSAIIDYSKGMMDILNKQVFKITGLDFLNNIDDLAPSDVDNGRDRGRNRRRGRRGRFFRRLSGKDPKYVKSLGRTIKSSVSVATATRPGLLSRIGSVLSRGAARSAAKAVPIAGAAVGAALVAERLASGDNVGAAMEGLSAAASTVPVIGSAVGGVIGALIVARDVVNEVVSNPEEDYSDPAAVTPDNLREMETIEANERISALEQELEKSRQEYIQLRESNEAPPDLTPDQKKLWLQDREKLRTQIIESYESRNAAIRASIIALQEHLRESKRIEDSIPEVYIVP